MYFPFPLFQQEMLYSAIDNIDLKIETPDGKIVTWDCYYGVSK